MWSEWYDAYLARDPPDEDMFPRFQVWNDHCWTNYQEGVNKSLRDNNFAEVDLGTIEEKAYKYHVQVVDDVSWDEDVEIAVNNVRHHHFWQNDEFKHQVVGWQSRVQEEGAKKTKNRPVRRLTNPDVSRAVVIILLLM